MDTSTHFNLNLVTGSDKVNPLTVDRPNYETIDEQMYKNQIAAISEATELKSGTTHAITCLTEGAVFFRFTATSDFAAGDTFTFNGTPVSAVLPDGSGLQQGAFKINGTVLCSIVGTLLTVYSFTASGIASDSEKLGGQLPEYYAKATDAISTYVHSRIGTVNNFVGNGANGKVKIAANIQAGDSVQINGQDVTAYAGVNDFVSTFAGENLVGKTLFFLYDSTSSTVNFTNGGGLSAADKAKLVPKNIRNGVTFFSGTPQQVVGALSPAPSIMAVVGYQKSATTERLSGFVNAADFSVSGGSWGDWAEDLNAAGFDSYFAAIPYSDNYIFTALFDGEISVDVYLATSLNVAVSATVNKNGSAVISETLQTVGEPPTNFGFKHNSITIEVSTGDEIQLRMNGIQWPGNCIIINRL